MMERRASPRRQKSVRGGRAGTPGAPSKDEKPLRGVHRRHATIPLASWTGLRIHCFFTSCASSHLDDPGAAQFASPAFSPAFRPGHHFHFAFLVVAGGAFVESAARGFGYRMAHSNRRTDSGHALPSPHRSVFFHHARSALVCVGMVVRHPARNSAPGWRTERSGLVVWLVGGCDFRAAIFATAATRDRPAAGDRADAAGGGRFDDSSVRASAHCELVFFSALVCCAGKMGTLGARKPAAMDSLVLSRLDVALGESAWRMALWYCAAGNLRPCRIRRKCSRAGGVCRDSHRASGSCHGCGLDGLGGGDARESVWLAAARAHLSLSERSLPDEPDR